jgi:hypothetical protein
VVGYNVQVAVDTEHRLIVTHDVIKIGNDRTLPKPVTSGAKAEGRFGKQDFAYLPEQDVYRCPSGNLLPYHYSNFFGRLHILPIVTEFLAAYPEINVRLLLSDRNLPLIEDHIDMAVRIGPLPDSTMIATRVGLMRTVAWLRSGAHRPRWRARRRALSCLRPRCARPGFVLRDPADRAAVRAPSHPSSSLLLSCLDPSGRLKNFDAFEPVEA